MMYQKWLKIVAVAVLTMIGIAALAQQAKQKTSSKIEFQGEKSKTNFQPTVVSKPVPKTVDKATTPQQTLPAHTEPLSGKTHVFLENAETFSYDQELMPDAKLLKGNVVFRHDDAYLYCDSAHYFDQLNSFNAYGNVRIVQGDTLFIYGDVLYYDGDTKMARLRHNVRMVNRKAVLTTDSLNYDRGANVGYYFTGGKLTDETNVLTSILGYYYPGRRMALFNKEVLLTNPKFVMNSDTLKYFTETAIAQILGPTTILYAGETTIYSERGWYDTRKEHSELLLNSLITHNDGKTLSGDTIFYDKKLGIGRAFSHVQLDDTIKKIALRGHFVYYKEEGEVALARDSALMIDHSSVDTLYLNADTLFSYAVDSVDKVVEAFHNVRVFRRDVQAVCDSARYETRDSILHLMQIPIVWSDDKQVTGDTIRIISLNGEVERIKVINSAFVCQQEDSVRYNQLAGKEIIAYVSKSELYKVDVKGGAQSLFFPREADSTLIGMNQTQSSYLTAYLKDKKIERIVLYPSPTGVMTPLDQVSKESLYLSNFSWQVAVRPLKWQDVFERPKRNREEATKKRRQSGSALRAAAAATEGKSAEKPTSSAAKSSNSTSTRPSIPNTDGSPGSLNLKSEGD